MSNALRTSRWPIGWKTLLALPLITLIAACSTGSTSRVTQNTTPHTPTAPPSATTQPATQPTVVPVAGNYSIYVDPTWGYSFEYPATWQVFPSIGVGDNGAQESSVSVMMPYSADPIHTEVYLIVRVTNNYHAYFVQANICGAATSATVDGFPAVVLDTWGGSPSTYYIAPGLGRAFFAKGMAFDIWFQSSARTVDAIAGWMDYARPIFNHVISSFKVGPGTKNVAGC